MKKPVFILLGFSLLVLISFTKKTTPSTDSAEALFAETLVGNWTYENLMHNGKLFALDSCDEMDILKFDPSGRFEALQHVNVINAVTGEGTVTNCNPIKINGNWSVAANGMLTRNNQTVEIYEITETTLKLKSVVTSTNEEGETVKDIYIDCYAKQ